MPDPTTYDEAFDLLHGRGAELTRIDDSVIVDIDGTTYHVPADELAEFATAEHPDKWQAVADSDDSEGGAEAAAHALLRMVGDRPGEMGRLRAARIVGGYPVPHRDDEDAAELQKYVVKLDWPLREITRLVDALITGRLMTQTPGPRPVLVLTRAGFRTLEALEAGGDELHLSAACA